jgi:1,4-dihydroxy-2-naphthoate octaprenyltransferase
MGSNPYGYRALGDLAVFVFFGLVAVLGCFALYRGPFAPGLLLPAASCGLLATAVLNINNIRDMQTDAVAGKHTLAMRLGARGARCYHLTLVGLALLLSASWLLLEAPASLGWLAFLAGIPLGAACRTVWHSEDPVTLNRMLKHTALGGFAFNSLFALGILSG